MNQLYEGIGISKQAVHQYARRQIVFDCRLTELMSEADDIRRDHPGCGVEASRFEELIGKKLNKNLNQWEFLTGKDLQY